RFQELAPARPCVPRSHMCVPPIDWRSALDTPATRSDRHPKERRLPTCATLESSSGEACCGFHGPEPIGAPLDPITYRPTARHRHRRGYVRRARTATPPRVESPPPRTGSHDMPCGAPHASLNEKLIY